MFKYCNHKNHLSKMIGMFLSRKIDWINNNKLVSIKEVNTWNRKDIAIRFVDELLKDSNISTIGGEENREMFTKEVACIVDRLLPNSYYKQAKKYLENKVFEIEGLKCTVKIDRSELEKQIIYQFEENTKEYKSMAQREPLTEKQLSYIKRLCNQNNLELIKDNVLKEYAKNIIAYLLEDTLVKPAYFDVYIKEK